MQQYQTSNLAENLRFLRENAGYSVLQMAEMMKVDAAEYTKWEDGSAGVSELRLCQLARIYNMRPFHLLNADADLLTV